MKHILTLVTVAFTLSLGACCTKGSGSCPMGGKKSECAHGSKACPSGKKDCAEGSKCCSTDKKKK